MYAPGGELTWNMVLLTVLLAASVVYTLLIHLFEKTKWHDREPILFYSCKESLCSVKNRPFLFNFLRRDFCTSLE
jgi:hypothetical protein